jgi:exopolysaccharide production protein ExoZ
MPAAKSDGGELYGIQMLRALAALAVVTHHALEESNGAAGRFSPDWLTTSSASGVDIFFVISGFIMLHVTFRPKRLPMNAGTFLFRRATRIYPFYWFCCFLVLLLAFLGGLYKSRNWGTDDAIRSLFLVPSSTTLIGVSWTLVYEIYFYLVFAATLPLRSMKISVLATSAAIICFALAGHTLMQGALRSFLLNPIPLEFCMGLFLAWAFAINQEQGKRWPAGLAASCVGLLLLMIAPLFIAHSTTNGLPGFSRVAAWGLPALLVVSGFLPVMQPQSAFTQFAVLMGNASYALYLTHSFVMPAYASILKKTPVGSYNQIFIVPVIVGLCIVVGLAAHLAVERPLIDKIRRSPDRSHSI